MTIRSAIFAIRELFAWRLERDYGWCRFYINKLSGRRLQRMPDGRLNETGPTGNQRRRQMRQK